MNAVNQFLKEGKDWDHFCTFGVLVALGIIAYCTIHIITTGLD